MLSNEEDYSNYSSYDEGREARSVFRTKPATSFGDVNNNQQQQQQQQQQQKNNNSNNNNEYYEDWVFALTSPAGLGALTWLSVSFLAVLYGSSIIVCFSFCFPLIMVPYIINEQMRVQLLPSLRKRTSKLRIEANALAMENVQLKSAVSRMQRQDYRLSVVEQRFEQICKRTDKDITKMKHLAKKNAAFQQTIKVNLAAIKIQTLMTTMLRRDSNGNRLISENEVDEVVSHIKVFGGRNSWKVNRDEIRKDVVNSMTKDNKARLIKKDEPDIEKRNSERENNNFRYIRKEQIQVKARKTEKKKQSIMINSVASSEQSSKIIPEAQEILTVSNKNNSSYKLQSNVKARKTEKEEQSIMINSVASSSQSSKIIPDAEEPLTVSNKSNSSYKLQSDGFLIAKRSSNDDIGGIQAALSSGTADSPIDIDSILFNGQNMDQIKSE